MAFANGPDGALYVADLYREILDFSDGIPESIKRFKDLNRGNDRGRIYRIVPEGFQQPPLPRLGRFSTAELVATLDHPNAWHRETASRLLYTRQDKSAIPALARLSRGRRRLLWAVCMRSMRSTVSMRWRKSYVLRALDDPDPGVREHGVRLSERIIAAHGLSETLWRRLKARVDDPDLRVRYQLAFTLGEPSHPDRNEALVRLITKDLDQPWMHAAVLSSLAEGTGEVFSSLIARPGLDESASGQTLLRELVRVIGSRNKGRELLAVFNFLDGVKEPEAGVLVPVRLRGRPAARRRSARALSNEGAADRRSGAVGHPHRATSPETRVSGDRAARADGVNDGNDEDAAGRSSTRTSPAPCSPPRSRRWAGSTIHRSGRSSSGGGLACCRS